MDRVSHERLLKEVPLILADLMALPLDELEVKSEATLNGKSVDLVISRKDLRFVIEYKGNGEAASVADAVRQVREYREKGKVTLIPIVVVPYMGEVGQRLCEEDGVSWFDLSGNAHLEVPGLRVHIEGKPNKFKRVGRPRSLFSPKSARIARWLLMKNDQNFTQRELAHLSGLDEGFTSRIVRGLEEQRLISRSDDGTVRVAEYDTLLDAWREAYDFSKHRIVRGHVAARSSDHVLKNLSEQFGQEKIEHAATGLAGAWLWSGFAGFRLVVLYVEELPQDAICQRVGFHEVERGENVWLVVPGDSGVFQGSSLRDNIPCVHPVQIYLDLKNQPERAAEAAQTLREKLLKPSSHA